MNAYQGDILPVNMEAEQALLGAILISNDALASIPQSFHPDHFYERIHHQIYQAVINGKAAGKTMNPVTTRSFMAPEFANAKVGDMTVAQYLARLAAEAVSIVGVPGYADAITDYFHRREAMAVADDALLAGTRAQDELEFIDRIKDCRQRLTAIITDIEAKKEPEASFWDRVDSTLDFTADAMAGRDAIGIDPGIPEITQLTGPWQDGQLIVIGGDVKTGKSACAWQCFFNIAEKHPIGGFTGEMPVEQIIMREKARRTGISAKRQKQGRVSAAELELLVRAGADIKKLRHTDIFSKHPTLDELDERINRLQGEHGIKAFLVDYILKLAWTGKMEDADDFKKANRATGRLKDIAMKRNLPIIALTHINKTGNTPTWGKTFRDRLNAARRTRPTYKSMLGNVDKDVDHMLITHQAYPAVAALEPEEGTEDYAVWEAAMQDVKGKAEFILALSRENEFPRRKEIQWVGESTSFGAPFYQAGNSRELF